MDGLRAGAAHGPECPTPRRLSPVNRIDGQFRGAASIRFYFTRNDRSIPGRDNSIRPAIHADGRRISSTEAVIELPDNSFGCAIPAAIAMNPPTAHRMAAHRSDEREPLPPTGDGQAPHRPGDGVPARAHPAGQQKPGESGKADWLGATSAAPEGREGRMAACPRGAAGAIALGRARAARDHRRGPAARRLPGGRLSSAWACR